MDGDKIFVRTVTNTAIRDKYENEWQYHSRSDAHSKAACWGIMFDLLQNCTLLAEHARSGKIGFGINHEMHDYRMNRAKNLDLVVCTPNTPRLGNLSLSDLAIQYKISLSNEERTKLNSLPSLKQCPVGSTLIALEAKACLTEHLKARPRLYDELASSFQTIHGDSNNAIAAAVVAINLGSSFVSPGKNKFHITIRHKPNINKHNQPGAAIKVFEKIRELPRRSGPQETGYDAIGVVLLDCANDGAAVLLEKDFGNGTAVDSILSYESMIERVSNIYSTRFNSI